MNTLAVNLNALVILIISGVLVAAFGVQLFMGEQPCPLCFLQRLGMVGAAIGLVMNLRFGIKAKHYGLTLLSCVLGAGVAIRQTVLHICPSEPSFGMPVLGLSLWVWSFLVFVCTILAVAILLFLFESNAPEEKIQKMNWFSKISVWILALVVFFNILTALHLCGLGPCSG
jgi:disulfide bond formation protein DsbB